MFLNNHQSLKNQKKKKEFLPVKILPQNPISLSNVLWSSGKLEDKVFGPHETILLSVRPGMPRGQGL